MKYLFAIIGLLLLAVVASAQDMKTTGLPPVRTTDRHAVPPRVAVVVPIRSSGSAKKAAVAVNLPVRKGNGGGGSGASRGTAGAPGIAGTGKGLVTAPTTGTGAAAAKGAAGKGAAGKGAAGKGAAATYPSMLSAKQAADLRAQNAGGVVVPPAPGAH